MNMADDKLAAGGFGFQWHITIIRQNLFLRP